MARSGLTGILVTLITMGAVAVPCAVTAAVRPGEPVNPGAGPVFPGNDIVELPNGAGVDGRLPVTPREAVRADADAGTDAAAAPVPADSLWGAAQAIRAGNDGCRFFWSRVILMTIRAARTAEIAPSARSCEETVGTPVRHHA
ncbi:hypothetical protein [Streptosporangium vulgare]|uniref:Uncharacterized protein n=1 Tax=Streptosporangium vulgare TaxID=46190 RepID=A0ABV5TII6_9ACTN